MPLKIPAGIDGIPTDTIPDDPAQFVSWFKSDGINRWLANADTRNAISGTGISITGKLSTPATISVATELQALFAQPYMFVGASVPPAVMTNYRSITAQAGVVSLADGGAKSTITVGITPNGIGNAQLRQGAAASVIGNATNALANESDIVATADGQVLWRVSGTLAFASPAANPSGTIGLATVNGTALTLLRSDSSPALSQAILPTWTGGHLFTPGVAVAFAGITTSVGITGVSGANALVILGTDIAAAALQSSAAANRAAVTFRQSSTATGKVGTDGSQAIFTDSVNGDLCAGVASGGSVRLGTFGTTTGLKLTAGAATLAGSLGINGASPPAQVTGFGTPTSPSVVANFSGTAATTAQMQATIAQILAIMKAAGLIGA